MDAWFIAVGNNRDRKKESAFYEGNPFAILVHPKAVVSDSAIIGLGTVVMAGAVVQAGGGGRPPEPPSLHAFGTIRVPRIVALTGRTRQPGPAPGLSH